MGVSCFQLKPAHLYEMFRRKLTGTKKTGLIAQTQFFTHEKNYRHKDKLKKIKSQAKKHLTNKKA